MNCNKIVLSLNNITPSKIELDFVKKHINIDDDIDNIIKNGRKGFFYQICIYKDDHIENAKKLLSIIDEAILNKVDIYLISAPCNFTLDAIKRLGEEDFNELRRSIISQKQILNGLLH